MKAWIRENGVAPAERAPLSLREGGFYLCRVTPEEIPEGAYIGDMELVVMRFDGVTSGKPRHEPVFTPAKGERITIVGPAQVLVVSEIDAKTKHGESF